MLIENQLIETTWAPSNCAHYIEKGYKFTKMRSKLTVKAEDLPKSSIAKVKVECDYCGKIILKNYCNYTKEIQKYNISSCNDCKGNKIKKTNNEKVKSRQIDIFKQLCKNKGYIPLSSENDYCNMNTPLRFICPEHGEQTIYLGNLKMGCGCKICGNKSISDSLRLSPEEVSNTINSINNSILLNPEDYVASHIRNLKVKCGTCGKIYITSLKNYKWINTGKCPKCDHAQSRGENKIENYLIKKTLVLLPRRNFLIVKINFHFLLISIYHLLIYVLNMTANNIIIPYFLLKVI